MFLLRLTTIIAPRMLVTNLEKDTWKTQAEFAPFRDVLQQVVDLKFESLAPGTKKDLGNGVSIAAYKGETVEESVGIVERHRKFIDLQIVRSGGERIRYGSVHGLVPTENDPSKDIEKFDTRTAAGWHEVNLAPWDMAVLFPDDDADAHQPNLHPRGPEPLSPVERVKLVIKFPIDLYNRLKEQKESQ